MTKVKANVFRTACHPVLRYISKKVRPRHPDAKSHMSGNKYVSSVFDPAALTKKAHPVFDFTSQIQ
jgi:hypothetical protein